MTGKGDQTDEVLERHPLDGAGAAGLTRRQFLIGGGAALGALAVGGVVAQRTLPLRGYYYHLTGQCGEDGPVPADRAQPTYGVFQSAVLGAGVEYGAWATQVRQPSGFRFPVIYCLPGRGQTARWVLDGPIYLADFAAQKDQNGGVPVVALVGIDGSDTYWHSRASGEDRMTMLLDEFIPWYEERNRVGGSRGKRAVMGWSMGGYGAILAAEQRPDLFAAACGASPALWRTYDDVPGGAFDDAADFAENDVFAGIDALEDVRLRIDCGRADVFCAAAQDFAARYEDATGRRAAGVFPKGCHEAGFWRRVAVDEIEFLVAAMARASRRP